MNRRPPYRNAQQAHAAGHARRWPWCDYCTQEQWDALPKAAVDGRTFSRDQGDPCTWLAEASTIGLRPGYWPTLLVAAMPARGMEPAMEEEFYRLDTEYHGGELAAVVYATRLRSSYLKVVND